MYDEDFDYGIDVEDFISTLADDIITIEEYPEDLLWID